MNRTARFAVGVALLVGGAALWQSIAPASVQRDRGARNTADNAASGGYTVHPGALESGLAMLEEVRRSGSGSRWEPADVVARVGREPRVLLEWVRTRTVWVPYRGVLRGARGVLLDRQGNSLDRALLLSALLSHAGQPHRLAHASLSTEQARAILPLLVTQRHNVSTDTVALPSDPAAEIGRAVARHGLDSVALTHPITIGAAKTSALLDAVSARTADQSERLLDMLGRRADESDWLDRFDAALAALRDHWWVQVERNGEWIDLDPAARAGNGALTSPAETMGAAEIDSLLHHRVTVRVVAERWTGADLKEAVVLQHSMRAADSIGQALQLQILPEHWPDVDRMGRAEFTRAVREALVTQEAWRVTLLAGGNAVADVRLTAAGEAREAASGGPFGGLGRGIASALGSDRSSGALTATWLEYEVLVPGQPPSMMRRVLFDLVGDAARDSVVPSAPVLGEPARIRRSLALLRSTEILPLPAALAPSFVVHLVAEGMLRNRDLLQGAASGALASTDPSEATAAVPLPSSLHALALARFESKDTADVYLASPNILTRHTFLEETGDGFRVLEVTDIVANDVSVDLHERDGFRARLKQGVRDTNAEALLPGEAKSFDAVARAFTDSRGWMVVDSIAIPGERMPASARHRIAAETRAGFLVVAPAGPIQRAGREFVGWWRIDGRTGQTLGVSAEGWGQSAVERAAITIVGVFWLEYLICKGTFLWGQAPEAAAVPFPLNLATPLAAMERTPCSVDALVSALVAAGIEIVAVTWPLVLRTIAGRGYSGIFSERPWFATGEGDPGDLPPVFGNPPGRGTPEPECPPAGQRPSAEPEATKPSTEPAEPSERPSAGSEESGSAPPSDERMPGYAKDGSGMEAVPPENVDARIPPADRRAAAKERELDEALANHRQAVDESREADLAFERAKARDDQAKKDYRDTDPERLEAAEEWNAANREARARFDSVASTARQLRRAQYEAEAARYGAGHLRRLAEANRAAYQATQARDEAAAAWRRTGMTDYDSPEYAQFREANERFRQAQRDLSDAYWHKDSPVRGTDNTVPAPPQPSMPPTERAPVPGGANAPGSAPPPAGCGEGGVSPEAKSVGGAVAAGAGVGAGGGN